MSSHTTDTDESSKGSEVPDESEQETDAYCPDCESELTPQEYDDIDGGKKTCGSPKVHSNASTRNGDSQKRTQSDLK